MELIFWLAFHWCLDIKWFIVNIYINVKSRSWSLIIGHVADLTVIYGNVWDGRHVDDDYDDDDVIGFDLNFILLSVNQSVSQLVEVIKC